MISRLDFGALLSRWLSYCEAVPVLVAMKTMHHMVKKINNNYLSTQLYKKVSRFNNLICFIHTVFTIFYFTLVNGFMIGSYFDRIIFCEIETSDSALYIIYGLLQIYLFIILLYEPSEIMFLSKFQLQKERSNKTINKINCFKVKQE